MPKKITKKKFYFRKHFKKWKILDLILAVFLFITFCCLSFFVYTTKDIPRPERFNEGSIAQSTKIYDRTGKVLLYEISGAQRRTIVPLEKISKYLKEAVLAVEDKNFFKHKGVDFKAVIRAVLFDLKVGKAVQGGSTITQQLVRSYFLNRKKTLKRKTTEVVLSLELEKKYSKKQILEWYLNIIPFGSNIYGVEEASLAFFNKHSSDLSLTEAASLAALIKAPSYFSPYKKDKERFLKRRNFVLDKMAEQGYISAEKAEEAKKEKIAFLPLKNFIKAPHFSLFVKNYLEKKYGKSFLETKGLKVYTTIDADIQEKAEKILKQETEKIKRFNAHNGAIIVLKAETGEILAMVGSKNYFGAPEPEDCIPGETCAFDPKVNAVFALRQPGSAIKPFIYAELFKKGFSPESTIWDVKTEFNVFCPVEADKETSETGKKCYHPKNYDNKFKGLISFRSALAQSRNLPAVKALYLTGIDNVLDFLSRAGITSLKERSRYGLSLVLGGGEVKLIELTRAFSVFANEGELPVINFIKKITDNQGNVIEEQSFSRVKILSKQIARQINDILSDNNARFPMFSLSSYLYIPGYKVAAKSGTTQNYKDGWVVGYTPDVVLGVWVGNNNSEPINKKPSVVVAGPIWNKLMTYILKKLSLKQTFNPPIKTKSLFPIIGKDVPEEHCILYYLNKKDPQFKFWEYGVQKWIKLNIFNRH